MKPGKSFSFKYLIINMICVISQFILPFAVSMAQTYTFKRMWPVFEQPWYFLRPSGIAVDNKGFIYVADTENDRIQKFTSDGQFISNWGKHGQGKGEFNFPTGIAVDINNNLYVADSENHRIQKFNSEGIFVISWGNEGNNGDEQLYKPQAVAADQFGSIYVADTGNSRIQKFNSDGEIVQWDVQDIETFQFGNPKGIYADKHGFIYVTDVELHQVLKFSQDGKKMEWEPDKKINSPHSLVMDEIGFIYITDMENSRILKFNSEGTFITEWGTQGSRDNEFASPQGIAADKNGYIYIADTDNHRIQKFSQDGIFMNRWGTGSEDGEFNHPDGMALDKEGNIYIADTGSHCIQKFSSTGEFLIKWGTQGSADGEFNSPVSVAVYALDDDTEIVFVSDMLNSRIARFSSQGQFLGELGKGDLDLPRGIAADNLGNLFVADMGNNRIVKFSLDGILLEQWGNEGDADGEFSYPRGIAFVSDKTGSDYVYVADTLNHRIQKFSSTGQFIAKWGEEGLSEAMFSFPSALAVNSDGDVYVADMKNSRVQIFSSTGEFKGLCGELGSSPGQLNFPRGLAIAPDKTLYVADSENHRIQVFENTGSQVRNKAIIVAGGGPYPGNNLWDSTRMCSNFAYRTLNYQGFTKDDIYYLTEDTKLDLDNNGIADDVDGIPLIISFQNAITQWGKDAENLVIYITDHGGDKTFRLGRNQTLSASELDTWLDQVQEESSTKIIVIYDACESGSFISSLIPPVGKERIVITSTSFEESAYFVTQGTVSFSNYFWTRIFNGNNVFKAFKAAREAVSLTMVYQHPLLDYTGDGIPDNADLVLSENTFIGNGTELSGEKPVIGKVSPEQNINGINSAILFAEDVADFDSIARVWAEIRVPGYKPGNPDNTVQALPFVDLMPKGNGFYEAEYDNFNIQGIYDIAVYARDRKGNISDPGFTRVRVNDPLRHKAVIIAGGPKNHSLRPAIEMNAGLAYDALKFQGYSDNDIFLMSPVSISSVKNIMPGLENLDSLLPSWIGDDTKTLLVYLVGIGEEKSFKINQNEKLTASHLNVLLNTMQDNISGQVTVIYDASLSGSFLPELVSAEETKRIVISSASNVQAASFASGGDISFSQYFWNRIINGSDIYTAFVYAKNAVWFATESQNSLLDDNGNGIGNEKYDGLLARKIIPGTGIILTGNQPLVNNISADQILYEKVAASIRIENITTTSEVETAWAVIKPPVNMEFPGEPYADLPVIELNKESGGYQGIYENFKNYGTYTVTAYARDKQGNISAPVISVIHQETAPDVFEQDNNGFQAGDIIVSMSSDEIDEAVYFPTTQNHNFHGPGDEDWVKFYGISGQTYEIKTENTGENCDTVITLYSSDRKTVLETRNDWKDGLDKKGELLEWECLTDGIYYVSITHFNQEIFGRDTGYDLSIYRTIAPFSGFVKGTIIDSDSGIPLSNAVITTDASASAVSRQDGRYLMIQEPGTFLITIKADGYEPLTTQVTLDEGGLTQKDFSLTPIVPPEPVEPIIPNTIPTASITSPESDLTIISGQSLDFRGDFTSGNAPHSFFWNFDGAAEDSSALNPGEIIFDTPGVYEIQFIVTDADGDADTASRTITVKEKSTDNKPPEPEEPYVSPEPGISDSKPLASIISPLPDIEITAGQSIEFDAEVKGGNEPLIYSWDFNGAVENVQAKAPGNVIFNTHGEYTITFTVTDADGDTDSKTINLKVNEEAVQPENPEIPSPGNEQDDNESDSGTAPLALPQGPESENVGGFGCFINLISHD